MFEHVYLSNRAVGLLRLAAFISLALMVIVAATASAAPAQQSGGLDTSLSPNFGSISLSPGFTPDPYTVSIESGGSVSASSVGCLGYVTRRPDFELHLTDNSNRLRIFFIGDGDTTLIINDANGEWHCNDDSSGTFNPMIELMSAPGGTYDIWVGSYTAGTEIDGTLYITERTYSPASYSASSSSENLPYAVVCIVNDTNVTVNYQFRWGNDRWLNRSLPPGDRRWHSYEYDTGERTSPDFDIRFNQRLTGGVDTEIYTLDRYAASDQDCDEGAVYRFQYISNSFIDLVGPE